MRGLHSQHSKFPVQLQSFLFVLRSQKSARLSQSPGFDELQRQIELGGDAEGLLSGLGRWGHSTVREPDQSDRK